MNYPEPLHALIPTGDEMELAVGRPDAKLRAALARFDLAAAIAPHPIADPSLADACRAGLWLAHHFLDESHAISQGIHTPTGSFWHGIMHRREGDFDNACYWFRRVGEHPVYEELAQAAATNASCEAEAALLGKLTRGPRWDAEGFVELVRQVVSGSLTGSAAAVCRRMARREWELLFGYCYRGAAGIE